MHRWKRLGRALPYLGALGIVALSVMLVATIFLTETRLPWQAFLAGALLGATLAFASRVSTNAWTLGRRAAELEAVRTRLASETVLRTRAEKSLETTHRAAHYLDELMPAMIAYVDPEYRIQFHNRAYAEWLSMPGPSLDGRTLTEVFGREIFEEVRDRLDAALGGSLVHYERTQRMRNGDPSRVSAQYVPCFGRDGKVQGVFDILTDITSRNDLGTTAAAMPASADPVADGQAIYAATLAEELTQWQDVADRLACALKDDEFILFSQDIVRLDPEAPPHRFRELLLRLQEEEDNLIPPGAFIPLAEKHGLMPEVDRWVVRNLMDWAAADATRCAATYSVNVSVAALLDPAFAEFVHDRIAQCRGVGPEMCIEFSEHEGSLAVDAAAAFMSRLKPVGCRFALSGFGRAPVSFELLKRLPVDYMKIDAGVIVGMTRNEVDFTKVKAIARVARSLGIATIAECVEDEATLSALRSLGVDYAQGFAISRPAPLEPRTAPGPALAIALPAAA